ncbi:hypothetical protein PC129_g18166 [Phytophthora cactorum]|uniref:Uncharacterized protein n=1 Tax=Phytophthora cactorum TaxID=29920 RepID=A0A329RJV2_9STRA|nr:hypothetical protein PC111_g17163 [Phytophthora cactorum]KAG2882253.1 hypothetical protein PC114_g21119 [Phytophthora cactorum]KAG2968557.1 hypothetical protein PC118_g17944 [Phytophthora cactorum]KAG2983258.1 hypothetical protein PC119_g20644 [Phytophthora cactorum]KAG3001178.1 hypothetical protein PC120_g20431 [Phytophthora cactorum]
MAPVRVSTKRDRDERRAQIQQRLNDLENVNATPNEEKAPTAKRRRPLGEGKRAIFLRKNARA